MECYDIVLGEYEHLLRPGTEIQESGTIFPQFELNTVRSLIQKAVEIFSGQSTLLKIPAPTVIIGDIHGNICDLIHILQKFQDYKTTDTMLFLGDYVDRGFHSVEVIILLLALVCKYPQNVFMIRGNHEFSHINRMYGFYDEISFAFHQTEIWQEFQTVFSWMPLAAVVGEKIFCVHGGLSPEIKSLEQIANISRPIANYENAPLISDLVWSDPHDNVSMYAENHRGSGVLFGVNAIKSFLTSVGLKLMIRAHQCVADGFLTFAQNTGVTVFSSSEYCRIMHNKCGVVHASPKGRIEIYSLDKANFASAAPKTVMTLGKELGMKRVFTNRPGQVAIQPMKREPSATMLVGTLKPKPMPMSPYKQNMVSPQKVKVVTPKKPMNRTPRGGMTRASLKERVY